MKYPMARVEWTDHRKCANMRIAEWQAFKPVLRTSIGFVLFEDDERIVLVSEVSEDEAEYGFSIDKRMVERTKYLK